jgi:hypothetical protein
MNFNLILRSRNPIINQCKTPHFRMKKEQGFRYPEPCYDLVVLCHKSCNYFCKYEGINLLALSVILICAFLWSKFYTVRYL